MIVCNCGKEFKSNQGFNAHRYYCSIYVDNLPECERSAILERKKIKEQEKSERSQKKLQDFLAQNKRCKICGNPITRIDNNAKYCSKSCSAKARYSNLSDEVKVDTTNKLKNGNKAARELKRIQEAIEFKNAMHRCEQCNRVMEIKFASGRFCSKECSDMYCANYGKLHREEASIRTKELWSNPDCRSRFLAGQQKAIDEGRWPCMMHSSEPSYPEKYWMDVLATENIRYVYNFLVKHSDIGVEAPKLTWYKLDFYLIDYNVDLEIDGSQHDDQVEHDRLRDARLIDGGYLVYRIPWKGHWKVAEQLADLRSYLTSIRTQYLNR